MREVIDTVYSCEFCHTESTVKSMVEECEKSCIEKMKKDRLKRERVRNLHRFIQAERFTRYTIECCQCLNTFEEEEPTGCMGPDREEEYKCPKCGKETEMDDENFQEILENSS